MLRIYLARHGQDEDNAKGILNGRRDYPLSDLGREQAKEVAKKIKDAGIVFDKVYSSPLARAYETAKIITNELGLPEPEKQDGLIERDYGVMTGQPISKIMEMCIPDVLPTDSGLNYFLCPAGAEIFPELAERGNKFLDWLKNKHKEGNVLLVGHGDIGKMIYAAYYHINWKEVLTMFHFGNSDLLLLAPESSAEKTHVFKFKQYNV
jgi:broad specificity phosphatase PhoE